MSLRGLRFSEPGVESTSHVMWSPVVIVVSNGVLCRMWSPHSLGGVVSIGMGNKATLPPTVLKSINHHSRLFICCSSVGLDSVSLYNCLMLSGWSKDGRDTDDQKQSPADMTVFVQNLLQQMVSLFSSFSLFVCFFNYNALDEMGSRIDELEQSINELRTEMGQEGSPSPSAALKPKEEPRTADDSA
ncbi:hypothetical protein RHMOL_Rhmol04G0356200 [Rhododendron molle]|uniref:Uncharacterized protein n=1 Tax=Rhododendron molle TaxID=49168 RepID=A0ACC0P817_RHOML|nr:hypothetical protein RHMOL_Rhmol04G0356200 [Rhododendron molle]